jgi:hypothetical protein
MPATVRVASCVVDGRRRGAASAGVQSAAMTTKHEREVAHLGLPAPSATTEPVTERELASLPAPAQRYLRFMKVVGRPRDVAFSARLRGRFRASPSAGWQAIETWQYNLAAPELARLFFMRLRFFGLPVQGRDFYLRGRGSLVIRPLDLFTVQDMRGPELDLGELVTWLNDAVLLAPSMLLGTATTWTAVDDGAFDLALRDREHVVTARVFVDERGAVTDFHTDDRWLTPPGSQTRTRTRWTTPVAGWHRAGDRMLPTRAGATWKRPEGDLPYAEIEFRAGDVTYGPLA